jgi:hypothetical protein
MGKWWDEFTKTFHGKRHIITNYAVLGSDTEATALSYMIVVERIKHTSVIATAMYYDKFVKQDGRWLMKERYQLLDPGMAETDLGKRLFAEDLANSKK